MPQHPDPFRSVLPELYDALIDWPKRLANEAPLLREMTAGSGSPRVLDAACGTGRHAAMMEEWGMEVSGADASPAMIQQARALHADRPNLSWIVRSFETPAQADESPFGLVLCIGNSLSLAGDADAVHRALDALWTHVAPGGTLLVQVLNLWAVKEGPSVWQKCMAASVGGRQRVLLKGLHRVGARGYIDLIDLSLAEGPPSPRYDQPSFLGIDAQAFQDFARKVGAASLECWGNYQKKPYAAESSPDLIAVVHKSG